MDSDKQEMVESAEVGDGFWDIGVGFWEVGVVFWSWRPFFLTLTLFFCILIWLNHQLGNISPHKIKYETKKVSQDILIWSFILMRHLGVPIGLMISALGPVLLFFGEMDTQGGVAFESDPKGMDSVSQIVMTSIFYGLIFAGLGFFVSSRYRNPLRDRRKNKASVSSTLITIILIAWVIHWVVLTDDHLDAVLSSPSLFGLASVGLMLILAVSFSNSENRFQVLSKASLFGALITTIIGLIVQYSYQAIGIIVAFSGMTFGLFAYICIYMFSYCYNCVDQVKPDRMSWHWIEAYAFILFMFLAPSTAKDLIFADEQAAEIERLEQRIEQLENSQEINLKKQE